jgi:site-specific recombinase XerD
MTDATERFVTWQRQYNGVSEERCRQIRRFLTDLGTFVGGSPEDTTARDFQGWLGLMAEQGAHPNTVRKNGNMVRPFFRWATREHLMPADRLFAISEVPNPRGATGDSKPKPYRRKEIARLWGEVEADYPLSPDFVVRWRKGTSRWKRVWRHAARLQYEAVIHLCLHGGLRREEVFRLTVDDIHPDNAYIVVQGAAKGQGREYRQREIACATPTRRKCSGTACRSRTSRNCSATRASSRPSPTRRSSPRTTRSTCAGSRLSFPSRSRARPREG